MATNNTRCNPQVSASPSFVSYVSPTFSLVSNTYDAGSTSTSSSIPGYQGSPKPSSTEHGLYAAVGILAGFAVLLFVWAVVMTVRRRKAKSISPPHKFDQNQVTGSAPQSTGQAEAPSEIDSNQTCRISELQGSSAH